MELPQTSLISLIEDLKKGMLEHSKFGGLF
jgi:hypothetical protein